MFCPKCGFEQSAENVRFCSRCGFSLAELPRLLLTDGLSEVATTGSPTDHSLYRRITARVGAKVVFFSIFTIPVAFFLAYMFDSPGPLLIWAAVFLLGWAEIAYGQIFGRKPQPEPLTADQLAGSPEKRELRPASPPLSWAHGKPIDTAEMIQPPSITETTTKLLRIETDPKAR